MSVFGMRDLLSSLLGMMQKGPEPDLMPDQPGYKEFISASNAEYEERKYVKAKKMYEEACDLGHPLAQVNMGLWYLEGNRPGVKKNLRKAYDLFSQSAERKIGMAQYNLANFYYTGKGGIVSVDQERAYKLVKEAIKDNRIDNMRQGDPYFMLASMHLQGHGCQKSAKRALQYAEKANKFFHPGATPEFLQMIRMLTFVSSDDIQEETDQRWDRMCAWLDEHPDEKPDTMQGHLDVLRKFGFQVQTKLTKKQLGMKGGFDKFMSLTGGSFSMMEEYEASSDPLPPKKCDHCNAPGATKRCSKCGEYYCNRACQRAAWRDHREVCLAVQAAKE